jgi:glycosyltransferase involved in cell wall biosynthesis
MKLSIIIPLYNEEDNILHVLNKLSKVNFKPYARSVEIIIIDDCSTDRSYERANDFKNDMVIHLFRQQKNRGKGAAVRRGFEEAKGDVMLIQDADLELDPSDIPDMLKTMTDLNVQFVNGSRYLPGKARPLYSYKRYLANKLFTFMTSVLINVRLTDMACGYKLIHRDLLNKIVIRENRFGFEAELIIKALKVRRNNIAEVPVQYYPRNKGEGKKFHSADAIKMLWTIVKYGLFRLR